MLQARFWSVRTHALTSKWRKDVADKCPLCHTAVDTVPHRLGGCSHTDINIKVKHRHGAAVGQIVHAIQSGKHGDCFILHDAEGQDAGYGRLPTWMLQMPRIPSRPDSLLLEDSEQAPGGHVLGISKLAKVAPGGGDLHDRLCTCCKGCRQVQATPAAVPAACMMLAGVTSSYIYLLLAIQE